MFMYLGAFLFLTTFILLAPQPRAYLTGIAAGLTGFMSAWAPFSYLIVMIMLAAMCAGIYVIQSWPKRVDAENPMTKYRREAEAPVEED